MEPATFVGLDVHKRSTSVAIAEVGRGGEVRFWGEIPSTPEALHRLVERLQRKHRQLSFCCEAGPCGHGVHRQLSGLGQECSVVAPSLIPSRPGDRVKTSRRWLTTVRFDHPAQQIVLQDCIHAVEDAEARLARLEREIEELLRT